MAHTDPTTPTPPEGKPTPQHWKWTVLASMASYIDAGSIVAGAAGLVLWQAHLNMSEFTVGLLSAFSANAFAAAVGALVGGRLGDLFGRKRIYAYDLLVYALGALIVVFALNIPMLFLGFVILGLAVGADVPTSLALVGELSPPRARGRLVGFTQIAWSLGPVVVLVLALVLSPLGLLGIRIVFAHLCVVALVTWYLRRGMVESARWSAASGARTTAVATSASTEQPTVAPVPANPLARSRLRDLFAGPNLTALVFTGSAYVLWNTAAGTNGFFLPYILRTVGTQGQAGSVAFQSMSFLLTLVAVAVVFMPLADTRFRRPMFVVGAVLEVVAFAAFALLPLSLPVALVNIVLFGIGSALAGEPFYKVWSQEMFPTMLRTTAQGLTFAAARIVLGVWSVFVPLILASSLGLAGMATVLTLMLAVFAVLGSLFMPNTAGRSLEDIERERAQRPAGP